MADLNEKLAASLAVLEELQRGGRRIFRTAELSRYHRERLHHHGFLQPVMKGWWMSTSPGVLPGDTTLWYSSFWEFCALYCADRFGSEWHLSPEQSLLILAEASAVPRQLVVYTPKGTNNQIDLPHQTGIYDLKHDPMPPKEDLIDWGGLRLFALSVALIKTPPSFYERHPVEAQVALTSLRDVSDLLPRLLDGGHSVVAGRLAGAFRRIGRGDVANEIIAVMERAGFAVRETDPFVSAHAPVVFRGFTLPIVSRLTAFWNAMRGPVEEVFPTPPGSPEDAFAYLRAVEDCYESDAYHSLSIEGYRVTPELIHRVRAGNWDPTGNEADRRDRDALAARGYWQAFQAVKGLLERALSGEDPGPLLDAAHREWYRELFQPFVSVGQFMPGDLARYRNEAVFLRGSRHVPPRPEVIREAMPALLDLIRAEEAASVRAVLGHWMFGYIHPYPDGNGRIARFLMNVMLAWGGYPWTVIRVDDRKEYLTALETASVASDIGPFAAFVADRVREQMADPAVDA
jgi:fido (protein-threonine AMPylation protein)